MKLFTLATALGLTLAVTTGTGGGSTAPSGEILEIAATGTGGGSTAPSGEILEIA